MIGQLLDYTVSITSGITTKTIWRANESEAMQDYDEAVSAGALTITVKRHSIVLRIYGGDGK